METWTDRRGDDDRTGKKLKNLTSVVFARTVNRQIFCITDKLDYGVYYLLHHLRIVLCMLSKEKRACMQVVRLPPSPCLPWPSVAAVHTGVPDARGETAYDRGGGGAAQIRRRRPALLLRALP